MKNITRAFVLALVVTGAVASTQTSSLKSAKTLVSTRNSMMPVPMCPPDDPNACGIRK